MKLIKKLQSELQNIRLAINVLFSKQKEQVKNNVPFVSQFAHPEFAERILKDGAEIKSDPNWRATGAESAEEYNEWVLTICGMACTSMVLQYLKKRKVPIVTLAKDAKIHGVYKERNGQLSSMHYKEFANWIQSYDIHATVFTRLGVGGLQQLLTEGDVVIVSVNPNIRGYTTVDTTQCGGHLVLITGYDKKENTLTFHNPSGFTSCNTQENHTVLVPNFLKYYAGRGIALRSK